MGAEPIIWNNRDVARERAAKRSAVLHAAAATFVEHGFYTTSLDDVSRRLGVTKPTLYYYFKSKEAILFECLQLALQSFEGVIDNAIASSASPLDQLASLMRLYAVEIVTTDFDRCGVRVGEEPLSADYRARLKEAKRRIDRKLRGIVEAGIADGSIRPCNSMIAVAVFFGALRWIAHWFDPSGKISLEEVAEQHVELLLGGLRNPDGAGAGGAG